MYFHGDNHEQGCQLGLKILGAQKGGVNFRVYEANFCPKTEITAKFRDRSKMTELLTNF